MCCTAAIFAVTTACLLCTGSTRSLIVRVSVRPLLARRENRTKSVSGGKLSLMLKAVPAQVIAAQKVLVDVPCTLATRVLGTGTTAARDNYGRSTAGAATLDVARSQSGGHGLFGDRKLTHRDQAALPAIIPITAGHFLPVSAVRACSTGLCSPVGSCRVLSVAKVVVRLCLARRVTRKTLCK